MDIRDEIDRSFGSGPDDGGGDGGGVGELLVAGRRALLRRRLTVGAGALATVAIIGGTTWAATGSGGDRADDVPVAGGGATGQPTRAASPSAPPSASPSSPPEGHRPSNAEIDHALRDLDLVAYDDTGKLVIDPRVTVVDRVANPFHQPSPQGSAGVAVEFHHAVYWFALAYAGDGSSSSTQTWAGGHDEPFADWVRGQNGIAKDDQTSVGDPVMPGITYIDLVEFVGNTERLQPVKGATILVQRPHVSVGDSFAGPNDHTAVAEVKAADGTVYYVLARSFDGKPGQYIAVPKAKGGATVDDFLAMAKKRYAEGGGGLL
jgi:hypothetical protein